LSNLSKKILHVKFPNISEVPIVRAVAYALTPFCAGQWNSDDSGIILAGDAAHTMLPYMGQRIGKWSPRCFFNLAWKLSYVHNGYANPSLISGTYISERAPLVKNMIELSSQVTEKILALARGDEGNFEHIYNKDVNLIKIDFQPPPFQKCEYTGILFPRVQLKTEESEIFTDDIMKGNYPKSSSGNSTVPSFTLWTTISDSELLSDLYQLKSTKFDEI